MSNSSGVVNNWEFLDPWGVFRQMRETYLETTADALVNLVNTEEYAKVSGAMLSSNLQIAEPVREWMEKVMPHVLAHYGLPSRKEVISVASRLTSIEMRLDDLEATLDEIRQLLRQNQQPGRKAASAGAIHLAGA